MNKLEECARAASKESTDEGKTRAVIRCLMEPSPELLATMFEHRYRMDTALGRERAAQVWRAMLQSVLDEREG